MKFINTIAAITVSFQLASVASAQPAPTLGHAHLTGNTEADTAEIRKQADIISADYRAITDYQAKLDAGTAVVGDDKNCVVALNALQTFVQNNLPKGQDKSQPDAGLDPDHSAADGLTYGNQILAIGVKSKILDALDYVPCPTVPDFKKYGAKAYSMIPAGQK